VSRQRTPRLAPSKLLYKSTAIISDLATVVASVLYDRVLAETKQELDHLTKQLQKARAVRITSASGTVYVEGQFEDGSYSLNPDLWFVDLTKQFALCTLSDLSSVQICIGGIYKAHFGTNSAIVGIVDRDEPTTYMNGWGRFNFTF
jgi:hypothetical protein